MKDNVIMLTFNWYYMYSLHDRFEYYVQEETSLEGIYLNSFIAINPFHDI